MERKIQLSITPEKMESVEDTEEVSKISDASDDLIKTYKMHPLEF